MANTFMDGDCKDCHLKEFCYILDCIDYDVKEELTNRGEF